MSDHDADPFDLLYSPDDPPIPPPKSKAGFWQTPRDQKTLDQNLIEGAIFGDPELGQGKPRRKKPPDHNPRMRRLLEDRGYAATKVETWRQFPSGFSCKVDLHGLWDWEGTKEGFPRIYLQGVTGEEGYKRHLREMTSDKKALDNRRPKLVNLRMHLSQGDWCGIAIFEKQENGRWSHRIVRITTALVDEACGRKRKPKA